MAMRKTQPKKIDLENIDSTKLATQIIADLKKNKMYEQGKYIADISMAYIEMINEVNAAYIERLQELLKDFKDLDKEEKIASEHFDLEHVKAKLQAR